MVFVYKFNHTKHVHLNFQQNSELLKNVLKANYENKRILTEVDNVYRYIVEKKMKIIVLVGHGK